MLLGNSKGIAFHETDPHTRTHRPPPHSLVDSTLRRFSVYTGLAMASRGERAVFLPIFFFIFFYVPFSLAWNVGAFVLYAAQLAVALVLGSAVEGLPTADAELS